MRCSKGIMEECKINGNHLSKKQKQKIYRFLKQKDKKQKMFMARVLH